MTTWTRNIGKNRGKPRLWLEGAILTECGFKHGDRWEISERIDHFLIRKDVEGNRRIAGTPERPIIDINHGEILKGYGPKVELRCLTPGFITVENVK